MGDSCSFHRPEISAWVTRVRGVLMSQQMSHQSMSAETHTAYSHPACVGSVKRLASGLLPCDWTPQTLKLFAVCPLPGKSFLKSQSSNNHNLMTVVKERPSRVKRLCQLCRSVYLLCPPRPRPSAVKTLPAFTSESKFPAPTHSAVNPAVCPLPGNSSQHRLLIQDDEAGWEERLPMNGRLHSLSNSPPSLPLPNPHPSPITTVHPAVCDKL